MAFVAEDDADLIQDAEALDRAADTETEFKPWRQLRDDVEARHRSEV